MRDIHEVTFGEDNADVDLIVDSLNPTLSNDELIDSMLIKALNDNSGIFGERLALNYFKKISLSPDANIKSVVWMNEISEIGYAYDIELETMNGVKKLCEVKTRFVQYPQQADKWIISPKELAVASDMGENYFVFCINVGIEPSTRKIVHTQAILLGYKDGLIKAIIAGEATVFLQIHK